MSDSDIVAAIAGVVDGLQRKQRDLQTRTAAVRGSLASTALQRAVARRDTLAAGCVARHRAAVAALLGEMARSNADHARACTASKSLVAHQTDSLATHIAAVASQARVLVQQYSVSSAL